MSIRIHSRWRRILPRIPLRVALKAIRPIALVDHRAYMRLLVPILRRAGMHFVGTPRYISPAVFFDDLDKITLGDRVVVSSGVSFLTHDYSWTTALIAAGAHVGGDEAIVAPIRVGRNVFIGRGALLLPGTGIGDDVIIGAGAVVRGKVESGSVVMGNPARQTTTVRGLYEKNLTHVAEIEIRKDRVA
jgi:acetyltransferase-like isoleucine patch superfamily enzyme